MTVQPRYYVRYEFNLMKYSDKQKCFHPYVKTLRVVADPKFSQFVQICGESTPNPASSGLNDRGFCGEET